MEKRKKINIAIIAIVLLVGLSIAYAALSTTLNIQSENNTNKVVSFSVQFAPTEFHQYISGKDSNPGNINITTMEKTNDTATFRDTHLYAQGAYAIYRLKIKNIGSTPVYLTSTGLNENSITADGNPTDEALVKENTHINFYRDQACDNPITSYAAGNDNECNHLLGEAETNWYVKISYTGATLPNAGTNFNFNIQPIWSDEPATATPF